MEYVYTQFVFLAYLVDVTGSSHVTLITIVIGQNPMYGYHGTGPVLDLAFEMVAAQYSDIFRNVSRKVVYRPDAVSGCGDTAALMHTVEGEVFELIERAEGFPIILSPGCALEIITLGDFARELDVPLLTSTAADVVLANRKRYPTLTTFSSSAQGQTSVAMRQFLRMNKWSTITVLCDDLSLWPGAATYYIVSCRSMKAVLTEVIGEYQLYLESYDSKDQPDYESMLRRAKLHCRIIAIATNANFMREIMVIAHRLEMTNGDYVFLYPEALKIPQTSELQLPGEEGLNEDTLAEALKAVIVFRLPFPNWKKLWPFTQSVGRRAAEAYNYTYARDDYKNDIALSALEAVQIMAQVLNETWPISTQSTGTEFSNLIAGRSYALDSRTVNIGRNGMRYRDVWIAKLNRSSGKFETAWFHNWTSNVVSVQSAELVFDWFGSPVLPLDAPACGFQGDRCPRSLNTWKPEEYLLAVLLLLLLVMASAKWYSSSS